MWRASAALRNEDDERDDRTEDSRIPELGIATSTA
jgi:hypothetical protein